MQTYSLADLLFERLDDEILVCDTTSGTALQVTGKTAAVLRQFQDTGSLAGAPQEIVDDLVKAGILVASDQTRHLSRRVVIASGAGVVGLGIVALALPNAAAAASGVDGGGGAAPDGGGGTPDTSRIAVTVPGNRFSTRISVDWFYSDGTPVNFTVTAPIAPTSTNSINGSTSEIYDSDAWALGETITITVTSGSVSKEFNVERPLT